MAYGWGDYEFPRAQMRPALTALSPIHFCALYSYPQLTVAKNSACSSAELISLFERYATAIDMAAVHFYTMGMEPRKHKWRLLRDLDHSANGSAAHKTPVFLVKRRKSRFRAQRNKMSDNAAE